MCSSHFREADYVDFGKRKLKKNSIPISYQSLILNESDDTCAPQILTPRSSKYVNDLIGLPASPKFVRRAVLQEENDALRKQCQHLKNRLKTLKNWRGRISHLLAVGRKVEKLNGYQKTFVDMQLMSKKKKVAAWTKKEKKLAMMMYYKSPATYKLLLRMKLKAPAPRTISRWIGATEFKPGKIEAYYQSLKIKCESMSLADRACVVMFDEMAIKKNLKYNPSLDLVEGFQDLGEDLGDLKARSADVAQHALVFMLKGLYSSWKLPLKYFITSHSSGREIRRHIEIAVGEIIEIG